MPIEILGQIYLLQTCNLQNFQAKSQQTNRCRLVLRPKLPKSTISAENQVTAPHGDGTAVFASTLGTKTRFCDRTYCENGSGQNLLIEDRTLLSAITFDC